MIQSKNIAWYLPRPKRDHYKGGMPLYAEEWIFNLAKQILHISSPSILNIFCGMNKYGFRVDILKEVKPDLVCDCHHLTKHLKNKFDIIFADPPYSNQESKQLYGTPKINYKKWTSEALKLLKPNGLLIVYHKYIMPNPDPSTLQVIKRVFIGNRTRHVPRVAIFFQRKNAIQRKTIQEIIFKERSIK
jgi:hypothetical protein